ncbi:tRNA dimethylallyltransferase [Hydrogenivirga caldilitoris]|uniref:tRNA dimethylallyltransferase n=1 Tax=Hydrogenivirga caldilitoris TaxID=246264 RepID=A0A497XRJ2_9AQUI|nr:tRNA (adenosine(37)-N6)-dimethylallyltransferase MiaA [Hydrogenivirga caldilitoris]RLJ71576.1 tRNA dimethylallyltransferase [Hydrogenivirga caldilitoris]
MIKPIELLVIGGATATGKSELACHLAKELDTEIISADSMSVYRGMDIGTAKPKECMKEVRHYLVDVVNPGEYFDAKLFEELSLNYIEDIRSRGKVPIVAGGTYLYIQALLYGIEETPEPNWGLRKRLYRIAEAKGSEYLFKKLMKLDIDYAQKIHPNDTRRIVRALEVFLETGKPFSSLHRWGKARFRFLGIHVVRNWDTLSKRIEERVREMIKGGLLEEVKRLMEEGFEGFLTSSQAIGYKELVPYLKGEIRLEEAVIDIVKNTKSYAKRQLRWFRRQGWLELNMDSLSVEEASDMVLKRLSSLQTS